MKRKRYAEEQIAFALHQIVQHLQEMGAVSVLEKRGSFQLTCILRDGTSALSSQREPGS